MRILAAKFVDVVSFLLVTMAVGGGKGAEFTGQVDSVHRPCLLLAGHLCSMGCLLLTVAMQLRLRFALAIYCAGLSESRSASGTPVFGVRPVHSRSILE